MAYFRVNCDKHIARFNIFNATKDDIEVFIKFAENNGFYIIKN
ncbi:MAG: hypothetical protein Edafosvirus11_16 [Edafosvirus sp.]|uniref:Uncharacterized protein n=1 Tax=Edafosvirus sp. TaxID=2487765 RepID=A0A3G4ZWL5_9VIRU|nr:MAG: hypothetical protein Edafosvirus11_16 [Edafosvirus sp.]